MLKQITLQAWAVERFDPCPSPKTLRRWARDLWIYPYPEKIGRQYRVLENAIFIGTDYTKVAEYGQAAQ